MTSTVLDRLSEQYPFITLCVYAQVEYVGVIQNRDNAVTTIYDFGSIVEPELKKTFIELANIWWWESNRSVPINIFLKDEWRPFKSFLKTFSNKDLQIIHGPLCSLDDLTERRSKRKSVILVKRV